MGRTTFGLLVSRQNHAASVRRVLLIGSGKLVLLYASKNLSPSTGLTRYPSPRNLRPAGFAVSAGGHAVGTVGTGLRRNSGGRRGQARSEAGLG